MRNEFGLDVDYFTRKLTRVLESVSSYKPDEMARELARLVVVADEKVLGEREFSLTAPSHSERVAVPDGDLVRDLTDGVYEALLSGTACRDRVESGIRQQLARHNMHGLTMPSALKEAPLQLSNNSAGPLTAAPSAPAVPVGDGWVPIETAPEVKGEYFWCWLTWGADEDKCKGYGMRWNGRWFAASSFYHMNDERKYKFREHEVKPTHWQPLPPAPAATKKDDRHE